MGSGCPSLPSLRALWGDPRGGRTGGVEVAGGVIVGVVRAP
jgi:hypothetical protein